MQHTISVLVKNEAGALSRMAGLFSARGYNIESITCTTTIDSQYERATIVVTDCDEKALEQILKQLNRLVPVIKVTELAPESSITLELVLIKVDAKSGIENLLKIAETFGAKVIDVTQKTYTLQAVCDEKQIKSLIELLKPIGIKDIVKSGAVAIPMNNSV